MFSTLMILQLIISVLLIIVVLLQFGKGAEQGLISSGSSDNVFTGAQKGNILSKITVVLSILFLGGSLNLARIKSNQSSKSLLDSEKTMAIPLSNEAPAAVEKKEEKQPVKEEAK
ncbi:MAG: preprotein translocase subunit SecG [Bacteriovoracaceae bacterium]